MKVMLAGGKGRHNDRFVGKLGELGLDVIRRWDANSTPKSIPSETQAVLVMHDHMSHGQYKAIKRMALDADVQLIHVSKKMALTKRVLEEAMNAEAKQAEQPKKRKRGGFYPKRHWTREEVLLIHGLRRRGLTWEQVGKAVNASSTGAKKALQGSDVFKEMVASEEANEKLSAEADALVAKELPQAGEDEEGVWEVLAQELEKTNDALRAEIESLKEAFKRDKLSAQIAAQTERDLEIANLIDKHDDLVKSLRGEIHMLKSELKRSKAQHERELGEFQAHLRDEGGQSTKDGFRRGFRIGVEIAKKGMAEEVEAILEMFV